MADDADATIETPLQQRDQKTVNLAARDAGTYFKDENGFWQKNRRPVENPPTPKASPRKRDWYGTQP